jgi:hypothetical protein
MDDKERSQYENIIKEYDLALQSMERALYEAVLNENCGFGGKYFTDQEISDQIAKTAANNVRKLASDKGIVLPYISMQTEFERIERKDYIDLDSEYKQMIKEQKMMKE